MPFTLEPISVEHLTGVHPDLVKVVTDCAATTQRPFIFRVLQGLRTLEQQKINLAKGVSQTIHSRHLDGHAVDLGVIFVGNITWEYDLYTALSQDMKASAARVNVPIEWGGDWKTLKDGTHYQLPWAQYPSIAPQV